MKHTSPLLSSLSAVILAAAAFASGAQETPKPAAAAPAAAPARGADSAIVREQKPSYPLATCVVGGEKLGEMGPAVEHVVAGRLVRLCCDACAKKIGADPTAVIAKIDAAVVAAQKPSYPLATCPVTGAKLDAAAVDHVEGTRLVRLANADALAAFRKDPKSALAKVDKALVEAQLPTYPIKTCVVSDEALGGEMGDPVDHLYGTRLVRMCCKPCIKTFDKNPDLYLAKLAPK